jgi:guanylate kinase
MKMQIFFGTSPCTELTIPTFINPSKGRRGQSNCEGFCYHFLSESAFQANLTKGLYFCWVKYKEHYYGIPKTCLEQKKCSLDIAYNSKVSTVAKAYLSFPSLEKLTLSKEFEYSRNRENFQFVYDKLSKYVKNYF